MEERYAIAGYSGYTLVRDADGWRVLGKRGAPLVMRWRTDGPLPRPYYNLIPDGRTQKQRIVQLGRIVLLALVGAPPPERPHSCHRDGDPSNNDPSNLYWGTPAENGADTARHGRLAGERSASSKLTDADVMAIRAQYRRAVAGRPRVDGQPPEGSLAWLAERYGMTEAGISLIVRGKNWRHVTDSPNVSSTIA